MEKIVESFRQARQTKPAYNDFYPFLEALYLSQAQAKKSIRMDPPTIDENLAKTKWAEGFPLITRWDFPIDYMSARNIFFGLKEHIPASNKQLKAAFIALEKALEKYPAQQEDIWKSFLHHDWEPWEEWVETAGLEVSSLLFLARSCLRPSLDLVAQKLLSNLPVPDTWQKGYCPVCGSLPSLLLLEGDGERHGCCSWCSSKWRLHRLMCPYCENRYHESLGYLYAEEDSHRRVHYCRICKYYFKLIDVREFMEIPFLPLEEWTSLHLDLLAQEDGWKQPPSPSPIVYPEISDDNLQKPTS